MQRKLKGEQGKRGNQGKAVTAEGSEKQSKLENAQLIDSTPPPSTFPILKCLPSQAAPNARQLNSIY